MRNFYTLLLSGLLLCLTAGLNGQTIGIGLTDADGEVNETVCIDLVGTNFVGISGMQFSITFDPQVLEFVSASGSINGNNVSMINNQSRPDVVRVVYAPFSSTGYTDPGPFVIGQICLRILQKVETQVVIGSSPTPLEFTDDMGNIIEDENDVNITNATINAGSVIVPTCTDGIQNGSETGVDCGGPDCPVCPTCSDGVQNGQETGVDCGGPDCDACVPTCDDGVRNGNETGVDCGGPDCAACPPTCTDGVQNGNETGVDCGGPDCNACPTCDDGVRNGSETGVDCGGPDCAACPPTCSDGVRNGNETGVDCGGPDCSACPTCDDGVQNGGETGVDCGGPNCSPCMTMPTCNDGIQNGQETGVDCGGPDCPDCPTAAVCGAGSSFFNLCVGDACDVPANGNFCVDVTVSMFTNITGLQFILTYPAANLDFVSFTSPALGPPLQLNEFADGNLRAIYIDSDQSGETLTDGTVIANICFTSETAGSTTIGVASVQVGDTGGMVPGAVGNAGSVNDASCGGVMPTCTDGIQNGQETGVDCGGPDCAPCMTTSTCSDGIRNGQETGVDCGGPDCQPCMAAECGAGSSAFNLCVSEACDIPVNGNVCLDVTVTNFTNITGLQFRLEYPAANLEFTSFTSPSALGQALQFNENADGDLRAIYIDADQSGESLPNGTVIATICFTNETAGATVIDVASLQVGNTSGMVAGAIGNDGSVNAAGCSTGGGETCSDGIQNNGETGVDCGGPNCTPCQMTDCGEGTTDVEICIGSVCGDAGATVCVPVMVGNFDNLGGLQFSLDFAAGNLDYTSFTAHPSLQNGTNVASSSDGVVTLVWNDPNLAGVSLDPTETAFEICFTVENTMPTPLTFRSPETTLRVFNTVGGRLPGTGSPGAVNQNCGNTPTCTDGIQNGQETGVDCGGPDCAPCGGGMNGGDCGMDTNAFSICVGDACNVAQNGQACVELFAGNFTNIVGFQMDIFYPAANLEFQSFTSSVLGSELQGNDFSDGNIRLVFFDSDLAGVSVADGTSIGTICFTNEIAGTTILDGDNLRGSNTTGMLTSPLPIANDGRVNGCSTEPSCTNGIKDGDEEGIDCGGSCPTVCPTCDDGIMNGDETGVDCGGSCPTSCPTVTAPVFSVGSNTADVGAEVCIDVTVADFTGIAGVAMTLNFDASALQLVSITGSPSLPAFGPSNFNTNTSGQIRVNYTAPSPQTLTDGQAFFTVCFTLRDGDATTLSLSNVSVTDGGGNTLNTTTNNGTISGTVSFDNLTLVAGSASGTQGTEVCVDVTVFNLTGLASLQFAIAYDADKLSFTNGMATGELPGLQIANPRAGILRAVWFDPNVGANSVADGNSIAQVCFNVLQNCESTVEVTDDLPSFRIRAAGPDNVAVNPIDRVNGTINAGQTDCGSGPPPNLVLQLGSASGLTGTEVCVNLPVTNFINLTNLSFSLTFDPDKLTFQRATNFGLGSISSANISPGGAGTVAFNWTSPSSSGESIPDGNSVASFCFTVDRLSVAPVNFANSPTAILARNGNNQAVGVIPNGGVINPDAPMTDGLTFQIGSAQASVGDEICLPVIAFEAVDLVSFQYTINYDPAKLEYIGTGPNYAYPGFTDGAVNNSQPGVLRVAWADALANPTTVPDGSAVFTICFRVLSMDLTLVTFGNSPTAIEFEDVNDIVDDFTLLNGQVNGTTAPIIVNSTLRNPVCAGGSDGSISLTVSGGPGLTYQWSPNVSNSETAIGLSAGTYAVTVSNGDASVNSSFTIVDPGPFAIEVASVNGVSCSGEQDGQITIATIGNNGPFLFDWSEGNDGQGVNQQSNLDGGSYSVTVTDRFGCARILNNIMIGEPAPLNIAGSPFKITRNAPGGVTIEVTGGRAPFTYSWTGPNSYTSSAEDIDDAAEPGTYCLTVTDNNNCTDTQCFAIIRDIDITSTVIDQGCPGQDNAAIDITVIGGNGTYDYVWSSGGVTVANSQDLENIAPGDYQVMITSGECQITQTITVDAPNPILLPANVTAATTGNNGAIIVRPSGGNQPLSYQWDDGPTSQNRSALTTGEYCLTATDQSGCTASMCYTVSAAQASILSVSTTAATCSDTDDGTVVILVNNGVAPFEVRVAPAGTTQNFDDENISLELAGGTYTIFITDAQGEMLDTMITVAAPDAITATTTVTSDTEAAGCSGMINLNITGGTGAYTVSWSDGMTGATRSLLCAGDYTPTITDANGCTFEPGTLTVGRIDEELVAVTEVACADGTEGGIDVTISGGAMPYTYAWTRAGAAEVLSTNEDLIASDVTGGVTAGDYTLTVSDATGATLMVNYTVGISAGFSLTTAVTSNYNGFGVSCADAIDGRIEIVISGQGDFMFEYLLNGAMVGMDSILENAAAGTYTVNVIDAGGCEISRTVEVTAPPALVLNEDITRISCGSTNDGSIAVEVAGGVRGYSYAWSTGAMTSRISGIGSGTYALTVTDGNGCTSTESYTLSAPEDLAATFEVVDATDGCNGSIRVIPLGGSGNFRFNFPQLPTQGDDPFAEGLCPGVYTFEVTDDNGCQTITMTAEVLDRRFPCLSARDVITPNGDGLNEAFVITCSDGVEAINNTLQVFNRWGQLVYRAADYDCSDEDRGINCFEGRTNDGTLLPEGPYYYIFEFTNMLGEEMQQRGSLTILRD